MKTLKLTFRSGSHSTRTMQLKYVAEELDEATIKQAMQEIGELQLFENKGVQLYVNPVYVNPVKAEYVDTEEKVVFAAED